MFNKEKLNRFWLEYSAFVMAIMYVVIFSLLMIAKHNAFNTRIYDFSRFSQAIWSTLHGKLLFTSITYYSILGDHFSPIMALVAPCLLIWSNERVLFIIQTINVAVTGLLLYKIFRDKHPHLAPWFLLAFYLNPSVHEITIFEVRRIVFGMPFLALALYALSVRKHWLMLLGLIFALMSKESYAFYVFMIGFYLLGFERDWKWGIAMMVLGGSWLVVVSLWVIPAIRGTDTYPQLFYFSYLGDTYGEILQSLLKDPLVLFRQMFQLPQLKAIGRILLPVGFILPFLKPHWVFLCVPFVIVMFLSSDVEMYQLEQAYTTTIMSVLFAAIAVGWKRIPERWGGKVMAWLLLATIGGYFLSSPAPFGGRYDANVYTVTERDRLGAKFLRTIPSDARVAAQALYVPHLTHRHDLYLYPWITIGKENIDYFVLDRHSTPYPFDEENMNQEITNMVADLSYVIEAEADGIYLIRQGGQQLPAFPTNRVAEGSILLERVEVALEDEEKFFQNISQTPIVIKPEQNVRVTLYWEAIQTPNAERSVSVRIMGANGILLAQHDSMPGGGTKPTSWWQQGWKLRDVYYLSVPQDAPLGNGSLDIVLYDTYTLEIIPFDQDTQILQLQPVVIVEP